MTRTAAVAALVAPLLGIVACNASFPTAPDAPATRIGIQLYYQSATPSEPAPGALFSLRAVAVDTSDIYHDVTSQAVWTTSDAGVMTVGPTGLVRAIAPGLAEISAAHEGATASMLITVAVLRLFPHLELRRRAEPAGIGSSDVSVALMVQSRSSSQEVTSLATWTSSNPAVATVAAGRVTGVGLGTAEIAASYNGFTSAYRLSIRPRAF